MIKDLITLSVIENLSGNGSQKEKQRLISENLSEEMLYIIDVCFNPFLTTKLHKLEMEKTRGIIPPSVFPGFQIFKDLVEDLKKAPAANDFLRQRANFLINTILSDDPREDVLLRGILMKILTKRMNIGIGAKLINKAVGRELVPDPSVMLASDDQKEVAGWDKIYCEEKYDGVRVIARGNKEGFKFYTRAFNELDNTKLSRIETELIKLLRGSNIVGEIFFDGELTDLNRKSVSGKVTQILKGTASDDIDKDFLFNVFDIEKAEVLETGKGSTPFSKRRKELEFLFGLFPNSDGPVKLARQWIADSMDEVNGIYGVIISSGGEGVILKPGDHVYECKRSKNWVKLKQIQDCDLEIVGWYPGEGKREGFIGGFICTDSSKTLHVKIGSGFTDKDLQELSKNPDTFIGKIAAVQYNEPITDKFGSRSLFLPRFIEVRHDKNVADDLTKMF
jgi:DNA ligase 1